MELAAAIIVAMVVLFTLAGFAYGFSNGRAKAAAADEAARRDRETPPEVR